MAISYGWKWFHTSVILDCVVPAEYSALPEVAKDGFRIIISAGSIDFQEDSPMWNAIHAIFPDSTATWAAIKARATHTYNP